MNEGHGQGDGPGGGRGGPVGDDGYAVRAEGLDKRYGEKRALDGFDLAVRTGTVWPPALTAVSLPLAVRRFQRLSR
ncbi:hypothetical protein [Streptomyces hirsutus]|uniref:hypothetical protein n=1 Tax=Streptomyces hirsutus TaxID=35620 RepID=UPI00367D0CB7